MLVFWYQCGAHTEQVLKSMLTRVSRHGQEGIDLAATAPLVVQPGPPAAPISLDLGWAMKLRHLLLGRKAMTNLDSIFKSRDITLPTKVCIVKAMVFPVVMYIWASWTVKMTDHRRINALKLWCWKRLLRVPWTARSNLSILKEINSDYSLEGLMLELKLPFFGHLM